VHSDAGKKRLQEESSRMTVRVIPFIFPDLWQRYIYIKINTKESHQSFSLP
jgi:hypothetical protein